MSDYLNLPLNDDKLMRLNFETLVDSDKWSDIDGKFYIEEIGVNTFQQFVDDEEDSKLKIGVYLKTVGELMIRYKSFTGHQLKYCQGEGHKLHNKLHSFILQSVAWNNHLLIGLNKLNS